MFLQNGADPTAPCSNGQTIINLLLCNNPTIELVNMMWSYGGCSYELLTTGLKIELHDNTEFRNSNAILTAVKRCPLRIENRIKFIVQWSRLKLIALSAIKPHGGNQLAILPKELLKIVFHFATKNL